MGRLLLKANFWAEIDGQVVLSDWRVSLLEAVAEAGSISGAAHLLGIDYRLAWERLREMEQGIGQSLVETQVGGAGGGGARLTPLAEAHVQRWRQFRGGLEVMVSQRFREAFGDLAG